MYYKSNGKHVRTTGNMITNPMTQRKGNLIVVLEKDHPGFQSRMKWWSNLDIVLSG